MIYSVFLTALEINQNKEVPLFVDVDIKSSETDIINSFLYPDYNKKVSNLKLNMNNSERTMKRIQTLRSTILDDVHKEKMKQINKKIKERDEDSASEAVSIVLSEKSDDSSSDINESVSKQESVKQGKIRTNIQDLIK